jgi:hypothetical protein
LIVADLFGRKVLFGYQFSCEYLVMNSYTVKKISEEKS